MKGIEQHQSVRLVVTDPETKLLRLTLNCLPTQSVGKQREPKGTKYVGVRRTAWNELYLFTAKNSNPDTWAKTKLPLWGKIDTVKMIIDPQFHCLVMMLPIAIPSAMLKKYEEVASSLEFPPPNTPAQTRRINEATSMQKE